MKYRTKTTEVDAIQWTGLNGEEVQAFAADATGADPNGVPLDHVVASHQLIVPTLFGDVLAEAGDWIVHRADGDLWPIKAGVFESVYEEISAHTGDQATPDAPPAEIALAPEEQGEAAVQCLYSWADDAGTTVYACEREPGHKGEHRQGAVTYEAPA